MENIKREYIIRYSINLKKTAEELGFIYTELLGNFAVIYIEESKINRLAGMNNILYIEPSRRVYYENVEAEKNASCMKISREYISTPSAYGALTGKGIICAVIDSGIDLTHPVFKNTDIIEVWDQSKDGVWPYDYGFGNIVADKINTDETGHGTSVCGIIAECVPESPLLVVKLKSDGVYSSSTANLIQAIDYCIRKSIELNAPMVINLSYGNNYGNHAGNAILEEYMDSNFALSKLTFVVGMGNDGDTSRHAQLMFGNMAWAKQEIIVNPFLKSYSIQIWKASGDVIDIFLRNPEGNEIGPFNETITDYSNIVNNNFINVNFYSKTPFNPMEEIFIDISAVREYVSDGIWSILIRPRIIRNGRVDFFLPVQAATSAAVFFIKPSPFTTMTIPATSIKAISVGAYNTATLSYASFSGRGYCVDGRVKPEISAPGVNIYAPVPNGSYQIKSGTSFATPFVSAGAAMLMQWGITDGNDPFLYGEKVKSNLINGAKRLPGYTEYPNEYVGYGALCVNNSISQI